MLFSHLNGQIGSEDREQRPELRARGPPGFLDVYSSLAPLGSLGIVYIIDII